MKSERGFFKIIAIIVVGIIILAYFQVDLKSYLHSEAVTSVVSFFERFFATVWGSYLKTPVLYLYEHVFGFLKPYIESYISKP